MSSIKSFLHSSSSRGVTTTHPWCSVFTRFSYFIISMVKQLTNVVKSMAGKFSKMKDNSKKPIAFFLCFMFVFVSGVSKVHAEAFPIPPVWLPINPYNAEGLNPNFELLSDDQKDIVYEILGAYNSSFLGQAHSYLLNPYYAISDVRSWWRSCGEELINQIVRTSVDATLQTPRAMQDLVGSATYKASTYESYNDYVNDTTPASGSDPALQRYMQFTPELTVAFKNWYAVHGGIEDWQYRTQPFTTNLIYDTTSLSGVNLTNYETYLASAPDYHYRFSNTANQHGTYSSGPYYTNGVLCSSDPLNYSLFLDDNGYYWVYDSHGNQLARNTVINYTCVFYHVRNGATKTTLSWEFNNYGNTYNTSLTYVEAVKAIYNKYGTNFSPIISNRDNNGYYYSLFLPDVFAHVYHGADWLHKEEIFNIDDLNYNVPSEYIDQTSDDAFVDIVGVLADLTDQVTDLQQALRDNTLVRDRDQAIPYADSLIKAIDQYLEQPKSGVLIVPGLFQNLGKYITYLYQQAKPLVLYTRDLITAFTFDGTGMSWVFFGAVSCGLIGGVLCKFLL